MGQQTMLAAAVDGPWKQSRAARKNADTLVRETLRMFLFFFLICFSFHQKETENPLF